MTATLAAKRRLTAMLCGRYDDIRPSDARRALEASGVDAKAHAIGIGLVRYTHNDDEPAVAWFVIREGETAGAICATLNAQAAREGERFGADPAGHMIERLRQRGARAKATAFAELAAAHPFSF